MWADRPDAAEAAATRSRIAARAWPRMPQQRRCSVDVDAPGSILDVAASLAARPGFVWLDDPVHERHLIACEPLATLRATDEGIQLVDDEGPTALGADPFDALEALLSATPLSSRLYGTLGYELGWELERLPSRPPRDQPGADLEVGVYDAWFELDPVAGARLIGDPMGIDRLGARLAESRSRPDAAGSVAAGEVRSGRPTSTSARLRVVPDDDDFEAAVAATVRAIAAGRIFETNLCRRFELPWSDEDAWDLYTRLRQASPAEYGAYLHCHDRVVASVSPECYLRRRGARVESRPIKGTRARGADAGEDEALARELLASEKDGAELAMIVDLVRNDLGRVCLPGSVAVAEHRAVMRLPTVLHTVSTVGGLLRPTLGSVDLLRASFPPGSITGAPKIEAMAVAREQETVRRGAAMGAIGWLDPDGDLELSVAIRTAVVAGGRATYHAGAGIVADSAPAAEREETWLKARAFLEATGAG